MNANQCFLSKENVFKESVIYDQQISEIHFDVVSGFVDISFGNESFIYVKVWDNARSRLHVDQNTFDSGVTINNSKIFIHSITPAFDFNKCIHAQVEIVLPNKYARSISLTGVVKMGMVRIEGDNKNTLDNINVNVELGKVYIADVIATSISVSSEIGCIHIQDSIVSQNTKIQTHTGIIKTYVLITKTLQSINQFGYSGHYNLIADSSIMETRFGFTKVSDATSLGKDYELNLSTEYGNSLVYLHSDVDFNMGTTKGNLLVEYEDESYTCKLDKSSVSLMNGNCTPKLPFNETLPKAKLNMKTHYGGSILIVNIPMIIAL